MESPGEQETPLFLQEPNTMFADPERIKLLENLTPLFKCVTWGFLWMSDKEMLRKMAENTTYMGQSHLTTRLVASETGVGG